MTSPVVFWNLSSSPQTEPFRLSQRMLRVFAPVRPQRREKLARQPCVVQSLSRREQDSTSYSEPDRRRSCYCRDTETLSVCKWGESNGRLGLVPCAIQPPRRRVPRSIIVLVGRRSICGILPLAGPCCWE
ncbi:hypothetical protein LB505_012582 [Fusarium chuoi]|nr:hypothetical protein LB505_012582 [Fusarium chuoi]